MTARLRALVRHDLRLQRRYGIIAACAVVIVLTALAVYLLKDIMPSWFIGLVIFTDNAAVGFFFFGGMVLLERAERVRDALAVTPVSGSEYLASKTVTFTALALAAVIAIALASGKTVNWPLYLVAVTITSVFYLGLAGWMAARVRTVTGYITLSVVCFVPVILPGAFALMEPMPLALAVIPTAAQFDLVLAGLQDAEISVVRLVALAISASFGAGIAYYAGMRALRSEFGEKR